MCPTLSPCSTSFILRRPHYPWQQLSCKETVCRFWDARKIQDASSVSQKLHRTECLDFYATGNAVEPHHELLSTLVHRPAVVALQSSHTTVTPPCRRRPSRTMVKVVYGSARAQWRGGSVKLSVRSAARGRLLADLLASGRRLCTSLWICK